MLEVLGMDETHESAYRALVSVGAADVPDLARRLALGEYDTERALRGLERHGLAAQSSARPGRWVAAPPAMALGALLTRQRHELEKAELAATLLAEEYRAAAAEPAVHDLVEVVSGAAAVAQRFRQIRLGAREEVRTLVAGAPAAADGTARHAEERTAALGACRTPGVRHRVVVERAALDLPDGVSELAASLGHDEQVRVVQRVPARLVIADRALALVPLTAHGAEPAALVVHAGGLLELLSGLFESVWRDGLPLRLGAAGVAEDRPDAPDGTDLEILSLLLAGLTDASVAKQLDLGLRTVQRRVKHLMDITGVTTRLQLGWHAYERGWVARGRGAEPRRAGRPAPPLRVRQAGRMGVWGLLLVGLVVGLGLYGVLVPGVPGSWLVWAAVLWWALQDPRPVSWWVLVGATALLFLLQVMRWALPPRRLRAGGVTHRTALYAGTGAILGFLLLPVIGAVPGFVAGVYLSERLRLGGHGEARAALRTAMRSGGSSVLAELFVCLLIAAAWLGAVLWG